MTRNRQKMEVCNDYKGSPEELDEVKVNWNLHLFLKNRQYRIR